MHIPNNVNTTWSNVHTDWRLLMNEWIMPLSITQLAGRSSTKILLVKLKSMKTVWELTIIIHPSKKPFKFVTDIVFRDYQ